MEWSEAFGSEHQPEPGQVKEFVGTPLWDELADYLQQTYNVQPNVSYSCCAMDKGFWKGWNVKYKKSGKALCTLYPKKGYFVALVVMGAKELADADILIQFCDEYTQELYRQTEVSMGGKWLAINVTSERILSDVKNLIGLRVKKP